MISCLVLLMQVYRADSRLEGVKLLLELLGQESLLPSVKYSMLCGWLGVIGASNGYVLCPPPFTYSCVKSHDCPPLLPSSLQEPTVCGQTPLSLQH